MKTIRCADVAALEQEICAEFGAWSAPLTVTQAMINQFAELTGDHQWIHVDVERARRESPHGATIAHGFLLLSLLPRLQPEPRFKVTDYRGALNYGSNNLRFLAAVPAGSSIHAHQRLAAVENKPKGVLLTHEMAVHNVGSERPALLYNLQVLYQPAVAPAGAG
jgi:acyl dehydratase